jgi:putative hydrolase of the HAD superfamily
MDLVIGLDADDTLWHNERYFAHTHIQFVELLAPYVPHAQALTDRLDRTERANLRLYGYGIKAFTLSMVETAIEVTEGQVPVSVLSTLLDWGKEMLALPVELLDGVSETVTQLSERYRLMLITKGDLIHQESKVAASPLAEMLWRVEVVSEKDERTYERLLRNNSVDTDRFVMVGNSVRSDVLPVLGIGARAVHIPYEITWSHEHVEGACGFPVLDSIRELPDWLDGQN